MASSWFHGLFSRSRLVLCTHNTQSYSSLTLCSPLNTRLFKLAVLYHTECALASTYCQPYSVSILYLLCSSVLLKHYFKNQHQHRHYRHYQRHRSPQCACVIPPLRNKQSSFPLSQLHTRASNPCRVQ